MKIDTTCSFLNAKNIALIEEKYNAKYLLETCLKLSNGDWANFPSAVFYTEKAHPEGSNYFAIYFDIITNRAHITNALPAIENIVFSGLEAEGEVVYSRYRHDYRGGKNGTFVDGGRDYFRYGGDNFDDYNIVKFKVVEDRLEFINE